MATNIATLGIAVNTTDLTRATNQLGAFTRSAGGAQSAILALTAAVSGFQVVQKIVEFQDAMLGLKATSNATVTEMKKLEKQARTLGATSVFSATQVGNAQKFLAQAGFKTNEILKSTSATLELAAAGSLDLATAADIASNVLGGMNLEVSDLNKVVDSLAQAARSSNTNVTQLGSALSTAAPLASAAGVSLEEVSAAIGVLSDNALQGERAGTGFGGIMRQLSNVTPKAEKALASYGIKAADVNIETKGLSSVLNTLGKVTISAGDAITIFGSEASAAGLILSNNSKRVDELTGTIKDGTGVAKEMSGVLSSELSGAFKSLGSALDESIIKLGKGGLADALQEVTESATGVISVYTGMLPAFVEANDLTEKQAANLALMASGIKTVAVGVGGAVAVMVAMTQAVKIATLAMVAFNAATSANPLVLLAKAAVATGVAVAGYMAVTEDAKKTTDALKESTLELAEVVEDNSIAYDNQGRAIDELTKKQLQAAIEGADAAVETASKQIKASQLIIAAHQTEIASTRDLIRARNASLGEYETLSREQVAAAIELDENLARSTASLQRQGESLKIYGFALESAKEDVISLSVRLANLNKEGKKTAAGTGKLTDAQKALNQAMEDGKRVFADTRTPLETYRIELDRLNELLKLGAINQDTFGRAVQDITEDLNDATGVTKENEDALKALEDQQQKTFDSWSENITDLIGGSKDLGDVLDDLARKLLQDAFVNPLLISVGLGPAGSAGGSLGGGAGGSLISGAGGVSGAGGIFSGIQNVLGSGGNFGLGSAFGNFATSGFGSSIGLSTALPAGVQGPINLTGAGEFLSEGIGKAGSFAGMAGGFVGTGIGDAFGFEGGGIGNTVGSIAGNFLPLPPGIGSAVGAFVGSFLDDLFGGSGDKTSFSFSSQDDEERFEGRNALTLDNEFGETLFKVFAGRSEDTKIVEAMTPFLSAVSSLESVIAGTLDAGQIERIKTGVASADFRNEDPDEAMKNFLDTRIGVILGELDPVFTSLTESSEKVGIASLDYLTALVAINENLSDAGPLIDLFDGNLESTVAFLDQIKTDEQTITQAFAGLQQAQAVYYQNFFSEEERFETALNSAQGSLDEFNGTIGLSGETAIDTKEEFRAYVEALDLTTEAGRQALQQALGLQGALLFVSEAAERAAASAGEAVVAIADYSESIKQQESLYKNLYTAEEKQADLLEKSHQEIVSFNKALGLSGEAAIDTKVELREYAEALDLTTEAGRQAHTAAFLFQGAIIAVANAAEDAANAAAIAAQKEADALRALRLETSKSVATVLQNQADIALKRSSEALQMVESSFSVVQDAVSRDKNSLNTSIDNLTSIISSASSARKSLRASDSFTAGIDRTAAKDIVNRAAGGEAFSSSVLEDALSTVSEPSEGLFSSFVDYHRDFFKTSISISKLKEVSENSLTNEEKELRRLTDIESNARQQLDALLGIDNRVLDLNSALAGFANSIAGSRTATAAAATAANTAAEATTVSERDTFRAFVDSVSSTYQTGAGAGTGRLTDEDGFKLYSYAANNGLSLTDIDSYLGFDGNQAEAFADFHGLPKFANGGDHSGGVRLVGERGPELEFTGPSRIINNSDLMSGLNSGGSNSEHEQKMNVILSKILMFMERSYRLEQKWDADALNVRVVS